ncbi:heat shock factor-binding protein 1b isoform X1 [Electrophorus electricus]|nr:heat shock factor-binding protein 1b isoform X1 [Electrophorus electricus]
MAETDPKSVQDLTAVVQTLLQQMQDKFQTMSDQIIGRNILTRLPRYCKACRHDSVTCALACKLLDCAQYSARTAVQLNTVGLDTLFCRLQIHPAVCSVMEIRHHEVSRLHSSLYTSHLALLSFHPPGIQRHAQPHTHTLGVTRRDEHAYR